MTLLPLSALSEKWQGIRLIAQHLKMTRKLTVNPSGKCCPFLIGPSSSLPIFVSTNVFKHSAQKSKSFWPSPFFCSSESRYFDWVISNLPEPWRVTRQTRRFVPPEEDISIIVTNNDNNKDLKLNKRKGWKCAGSGIKTQGVTADGTYRGRELENRLFLCRMANQRQKSES